MHSIVFGWGRVKACLSKIPPRGGFQRPIFILMHLVFYQKQFLMPIQSCQIMMAMLILEQMALTKKAKLVKSELIEKSEQVYDSAEKYPSLVQGKLRRVIRYAKEAL